MAVRDFARPGYGGAGPPNRNHGDDDESVGPACLSVYPLPLFIIISLSLLVSCEEDQERELLRHHRSSIRAALCPGI